MSSRVGSINGGDRNRRRGMILPFVPLSITFDDIRYAVDMPQVHFYFFCAAVAAFRHSIQRCCTKDFLLLAGDEISRGS